MLKAIFVSAALLSSAQATAPGQYNEKWLCDLYAGAQCHQTACKPDGKERCALASRRCKSSARESSVSQDRAEKISVCAKAMLVAQCGAGVPKECEGVDAP